jgi:hypothetical protein
MSVTINGTNGLTFNDASTQTTAATGFGFKNRIINGAMGIWQRGTTGTSGYSSVDRWVGINTTSMNRSTDVPSGFQYSLEFGNASATYIIVDQRIEANNCIDLIGQKITVSFWAKNVSGASWIGVELYYANAVDNFSGTTMFAANTWLSPSSSWTQYTFTIPSTVPASAANGIAVRVYRNTDTASTTRVTGVQLEKGSTATSFDYRPYGTELALCQRYCELILGRSVGLWTSAGVARVYPKYQVRKRSTVTASLTTTSPYAEQIGVVGIVGSGSTISINSNDLDGGDFDVAGFSGRAYGQFAFVNGSVILVTAEL